MSGRIAFSDRHLNWAVLKTVQRFAVLTEVLGFLVAMLLLFDDGTRTLMQTSDDWASFAPTVSLFGQVEATHRLSM
jgi:hypothetical protein